SDSPYSPPRRGIQETGDRRQPTPNPSQEGKNGNERGGRSKNCKNNFSAQLCA
ncbi:MAG: hypothetical protein F6K13_20965, partial [Okeania sp. SIO2B9]|nr:hypothetical protein [Okeania sp. SIO2B9]